MTDSLLIILPDFLIILLVMLLARRFGHGRDFWKGCHDGADTWLNGDAAGLDYDDSCRPCRMMLYRFPFLYDYVI